MLRDTFIYTLADPLTGDVRYVGKADNLNRRLTMHLMESKTETHRRAQWIKSVISTGSKPIIEVLDIVPSNCWEKYERYWIAQFRSWGFNLVNGSDGGDGTVIWTDVMRQRMSSIKKGQKAWNKGKIMLGDTKAKLSNQVKLYYSVHSHPMKNKTQSADSIVHMRAGSVGKGSIPVNQYTKDGIFIQRWESVKVAGLTLNISASTITGVCRGRKHFHTAGGFKWKYVDKN